MSKGAFIPRINQNPHPVHSKNQIAARAVALLRIIAAATLAGVALNFSSLDPIKALYWSAVVNGVLAAPLMRIIMLIAVNPRIMGRLTLPSSMRVVGWLATQ